MRTWPASMRSWTRARLMSGRTWARYWSRRRLAAAGSAVKVRMAASASSSSSSNSMSGTGGGAASSTPRVATYSGRTVRRRLPLWSMFLDGMSDHLSGLQEDKAGGEDHAQRYPLDGVEEVAQEDVEETGLTEEGEEELGSADGGGGEGDSDARGEGGGEAGVAAFGEVTEGEEGPDKGGAGSPSVQRGEKREMTEAEIDNRDDRSEQKAGGSERRHHEQKDGVGAEALQVGED